VRCRRIEQRRIIDLDGTRGDRIAKTHIDLDRDAGAGDRGLGAYSHTAILQILSDRRDFESIDIEGHAVVVDGLGQDRAKGVANRLGTVIAIAEQVQVACRSKRGLHPGHEQHRALEDKSVAMLRPAQPIQQPFKCIARQQDLEIGALVARSL
jgi:hypothetical protein